MSSNLSLRRAVGLAVGAAGAAATAGFAPMALAEPAAGPNSDTAAAPDTTLQEVVVTGSRIRRVDTETASPVFVLDQQAIQESGINTIGDLLERVPSVSGAATNPQVNNGGGYGESCVELRGLDCKRTLVLVDGRRIGLVGITSDATDVNQIPLPLIERVEVLKEGAGAIYGSDAIGGVVNFITRKDVEGVELNADYGRTTKNDGAHHDVSIMFGTNTDKFNFIIGGDIQQQDAVSAGARQFSKYALYLYGGTTGVTKGGSSRVPTGRIYDNPLGLLGSNGKPCASLTRIAGAAGTALTDYRCFNTPGDLYNYQPLNLLLTPTERTSVFSKTNYKINDDVEAYASVTGTHTHSGFQIAPLPFDALADNVILSKNSVYNPFGIDFGGSSGVNPNFTERLSSLGNRESDTNIDGAVLNGGAKGKLGLGDWTWDVNLSYSRLEQHSLVTGYFLNALLNNALGPSYIDSSGTPTCGTPASGTTPATTIPGCIPVNFFNPTTPDQVAALKAISANYNIDNVYVYKAAEADFNGKIIDLPGGTMQAAGGVSYDDRHQSTVADAIVQATPPLFLNCQLSQETCTGNTFGGYDSRQIFGELFVPLLKDLPFAHALNVDLGIRYSDYSSFGSATKGDFKVEYRPIKDLLVRGTFSQVFRVPTVSDIAGPPTNTSVTFNDPCTNLTAAEVAANANLAKACQGVPLTGNFREPNGQITGLNESNPNLKAEKGHVETAGFVYDPEWVPGVSFEATYWKYHIDGLITLLDSNYSVQQCVATGSPTFCNLIHRFTSGPNSGLIQVFENPEFNLGSLDTDGLDLGLKYALKNTPIGTFNFSIDWTHTLTYKNDPAPGAAVQEIAGTYNRQFGNYAKDRALGSIGWAYLGADALLTARYISHIQLYNPSTTGVTIVNGVTSPYPPLQIPSYVYLDFVAGYTFPTKTKILAGLRNLTDKQPPLLYQNNVTNANTDVQTYDTIGRQWFVGLSQKF
jgi:outer membrane receptor protein involved in Fe transport